jgi:N-acetyl-alpha-D-muramate 1-phosphate uridylyltransferase
LLDGTAFIAVNGDIWTDYDFARLPPEPAGLAHLVLVDNPPQHPKGDFVLRDDGRVVDDGEAARLTFAGIGVYRPQLLETSPPIVGRSRPARFPLAPLLRAAMADGNVQGEHHRSRWDDVGTPERLAAVRHATDGR